MENLARPIEIEYEMWCQRLEDSFKGRDYAVKQGDTTSGNECDLSAYKDQRNIGIEVVVTGIEFENIPRHLKYYSEIIIACIDAEKKKEVERVVKGMNEDIQKRLSVKLLKEYF